MRRRNAQFIGVLPVAESSTPVAMTNVANYSMTGDAESGYTITKGGSTGFHTGPYSDPLTGQFLAKFDLGAASSGFFGIDVTINGTLNMDACFEYDGGGNTSRTKSNGVYQSTADANASTCFFWCRRDENDLVELLRNTVDDIDTATVEWSVTQSGTVYINTVIHAAGVSATIIVTES